jgi:EmrB/QacA subfamily drug resistance transporter
VHAAAPPRRSPTVTLAVLAVGVLAYALSQTMVAPAMPEIQDSLGITQAAVAWTLTAYLVSASVMTAVLGRLGDMFGKKRVLVITLVAFGAGSAICAVADSIGMLVAGRVIQGAAGGLFPLAFGIIRDEFPRNRVPASIGLVSSIMGIGAGFGLIIGGLLVDHATWHWIFWLGLALTVVAVVATELLVPESPVRNPGRIDWGGTALLSAGLAAPLIGVSQGGSWGWTDPRTLGLLAAGVVVLALFAVYERRQAEPLVDVSTFALKPILLTNVATLFVGFAMFAGFVLVPQLAQLPPGGGVGLGTTATVAGLIMLPSTLVMLVAAPFSGRLGGARGSKLPLLIGTVTTAAGLGLFAVSHGNALVLLLWGTIQGFGIGMAFAALPNLIIDAVPQTQTGEATAVNTLLRNVGASIGSQIAGTVLASKTLAATGTPADGAFVLAFALAAGAALIAFAIATLIPGAPHARRAGARAERVRRPPAGGGVSDERHRATGRRARRLHRRLAPLRARHPAGEGTHLRRGGAVAAPGDAAQPAAGARGAAGRRAGRARRGRHADRDADARRARARRLRQAHPVRHRPPRRARLADRARRARAAGALGGVPRAARARQRGADRHRTRAGHGAAAPAHDPDGRDLDPLER